LQEQLERMDGTELEFEEEQEEESQKWTDKILMGRMNAENDNTNVENEDNIQDNVMVNIREVEERDSILSQDQIMQESKSCDYV